MRLQTKGQLQTKIQIFKQLLQENRIEAINHKLFSEMSAYDRLGLLSMPLGPANNDIM